MLLQRMAFASSATKLVRSSFVISRNIRMAANLKQKSAEALEKLKTENPYFEKYASKIAKIQESAPEEFLVKLQEQQHKTRDAAEKNRDSRTYSELMNPKKPMKKSEVPLKKLEDLMKIDLLHDKTADEIKLIWLEYHKEKDVITAIIPSETYKTLMSVAKKYPVFIFPIPRSQGYEFIMLQFAVNSVHFTPLLCYQVHKENAPECLNMVHYTEFQEKGIVLMRGEYDKNVLTAQEAQCLANQLQLYYSQNNACKIQLLDTFTNTPDTFKHMDVIKELENLQI